MSIVHLAAPILTLALIGGVTGQGVTPKVADQKLASPELQKAMARADVHNKRVLALLVAEGEDPAAAWKKNRTLSRTLLYEFEIAQLKGKEADAWATEWKFPAAVQQKPALVVLDAMGKVLARMPQSALVVDDKAFLAELKPHFAAPVDAEKKLAAALVEAKRTGRNVFIRFDAPW